MSLLTVEDLSTPHLAPASFSMAAGECVALTGRSGSGKSVLLRALADLDPNGGKVILNGQDREDCPAPDWRRLARYHPAEPAWWEPAPALHFQAPDAVDTLRFGLPGDVMKRPVAKLSTGERQRLALLRSLEGEPRLLLLDEPTAALDAQSVALVETALREFLNNGGAILLVSHDDAQADRLADRQFEMNGGKLATDG